ncbi:MAG: Uncharacterised protein [Bacteroidota bacterium]|nr:MAG: Uncharacterised protein [Bacteroidota bacterium]
MKPYYTFTLFFSIAFFTTANAQIPGTQNFWFVTEEAAAVSLRQVFTDDFEYASCITDTAPPGWEQRDQTVDCAGSRAAISLPQDADDEVLFFNESMKRDISALGLTEGSQIRITIKASASNLSDRDYYPALNSFRINIYETEQAYTTATAPAACTDFWNAGSQMILEGENNTLNVMTFTSEIITLNQDANWIEIGGCRNNGSVIDDLIIETSL